MSTSIARPAAIDNLPIYTYLNLPKSMRTLIPGWLWNEKCENTTTVGRKRLPTEKLFEGDAVDAYPVADDLTKKKYFPCHIHMMVREHGGVRIRITWEHNKPALSKEQVMWVLYVFRRFLWDAQSFRASHGTEHLPPHISVSLGNPVERDQAMSVQSIQLFNGELALLTDTF